MSRTSIEWTETTWNPVVGCSPVSAGCANCYAARMTRRLEAMGRPEYAGLVGAKHFNGTFRELPDRLDDPRRWKKPRRVFVNSMSDLFGEGVSDAFIALVFRTMAACPQHTFQILTKRPERAVAWFRWVESEASTMKVGPRSFAMWPWPRPNVWIGTSVENQEAAEARIPHLLEVPARVRFLSCEPLLGPVDLTSIRHSPSVSPPQSLDALLGYDEPPYDGGRRRIHWVIAGGESGPKARPMHPSWARSLRDQCVAAGVPYFWKQWGEWVPYDEWRKSPPDENGPTFEHIGDDLIAFVSEHGPGREDWASERLCKIARVGKRAAGRLLDGREWSEFPKEAPDAR